MRRAAARAESRRASLTRMFGAARVPDSAELGCDDSDGAGRLGLIEGAVRGQVLLATARLIQFWWRSRSKMSRCCTQKSCSS